MFSKNLTEMMLKNLHENKEKWLAYSRDVKSGEIFKIFGCLQNHMRNKYETECHPTECTTLIGKCDGVNKAKIYRNYVHDEASMWFFSYLRHWSNIDSRLVLLCHYFGDTGNQIVKYMEYKPFWEDQDPIELFYSADSGTQKKLIRTYGEWNEHITQRESDFR